jgi:hypothetical protein
VEGRLKDGNSVILQHVQQCGLAGIVETKEKKLGMLVEQTQGGQNVVEPVDNPHDGGIAISRFDGRVWIASGRSDMVLIIPGRTS